jgi:hypothetical protein
MDKPKNDAQFAKFFPDPPIVHAVEALYGGALKVPPAPRNDLLPLVTYRAPIAAPGTGRADRGPAAAEHRCSGNACRAGKPFGAHRRRSGGLSERAASV